MLDSAVSQEACRRAAADAVVFGEFSVTLSPEQLRAAVEGCDVPAASLLQRFFGALRLVGAALELTAATALILIFDPTLLSKLFGLLLLAHAVDSILTALRQINVGRSQSTLTERAVTRFASSLGASPSSAQKIGLAVDVLLPIALNLGAGALRALAVRSGRIVTSKASLAQARRVRLSRHDSARSGVRGGHTLARHVALPAKDLQKRLAHQKHLSVASTFSSLDVAETTIHQALRANASTVYRSMKAAPTGTRVLIDHWCSTGAVGYGLMRGEQGLMYTDRLRVVLETTTGKKGLCYILTAYPIF